MNRTNKYFTRGILIFVVQMVCVVGALLAGVQSLILVGAALSVALSLGLLVLLLQANKALDESVQEFVRLKQREHAKLQQDQTSAGSDWQQTETFKADEILARIMPAADATFKNASVYSEKLLQNIAKELGIVQGLIFALNDDDKLFRVTGEYAYYSEEKPRSFPVGETLSGQVAKNRKALNLREIPEGYITVLSGLGKSLPQQLLIVPILHEDECIGIMELASFKPFGENEELLASKIAESSANMLNELRNRV